MKTKWLSCTMVLLLIGSSVYAQDLGLSEEPELEVGLIEGEFNEEAGTSLVLDNTRTKIGRDFYEIFYQQWVASASALTDTTKLLKQTGELDLNTFVLGIEELPTPSVGSALISVSINDLLVWQQFVQARADVIEAYVENAVATARQYIINFDEIQKELGNQDQIGSGVY